MKTLLFIVLMFISAVKAICQNNTASKKCSITIGEVFDFAAKANFFKQKVSYYKDYADFNFNDFTPIEKVIDKDDYFRIGFNSNNEIIEIQHYEKKLKLSNFKMLVVNNEKFKVFIYEDWWNDYERKTLGNNYVGGFFVNLKYNKRNYFVNVTSQFGKDSKVGVQYENNVPIKDFNKISSLISIDSLFYPSNIIRFSERKPVMGSQLVYKESSRVLSYEKLFFFNIPEFEYDYNLSGQSCFNDFETLFEEFSSFSMGVLPQIEEKYWHMPLWIWGGAHGYRSSFNE